MKSLPLLCALLLGVLSGSQDAGAADATGSAAAQATQAELPRSSVDTTMPAMTGREIKVPAGGNLQSALNAARPGDVITLAAGATYRGPFSLPAKPGDGWIVLRTSAWGSLPPPGTRVRPEHAALMPKIVANGDAVITAAPGAHHYRFVGLEIQPAPGVFLYNLLLFGFRADAPDIVPHHLIVDRCYLHGDPVKGTRRGVAFNAREAAIVDSHLSDFKEVGSDSQAIAGWNGPGPFKIVNNYLAGAGENVLFGGADPSIPGLVPADIEIRDNDIAKPLSWKIGDAAYAGTPWTVKNLLELKNARRVLIQGNRFENVWGHAQTGFAVLFTPVNQEGRAPWSAVEDITFMDNTVRHAGAGVNMSGGNSMSSSQQTKRIAIRNNLFEDIDGKRWSGDGRLFQMLRGIVDLTIEHNTGFTSHAVIMAEGTANLRFTYRDNITTYGVYGIFGTDMGSGLSTLNRYFPGAIVERNVFVGAPGVAASYPAGNFFPRSLDEIGFADLARGDYRLGQTSRYRQAAGGGGAIGVDVTRLPLAAPHR